VLGALDGLADRARLSNDLHLRMALDERPDTHANDFVVVHQEHLQAHIVSNSSSSRLLLHGTLRARQTPAPSSLTMRRLPPSTAARACKLAMPWPFRRDSAGSDESRPRPLSVTDRLVTSPA